MLGEYTTALGHHRRALALRQRAGDRAGAQASCYSLALCHESLGQRGLADEMLRHARHGPPPPEAGGLSPP